MLRALEASTRAPILALGVLLLLLTAGCGGTPYPAQIGQTSRQPLDAWVSMHADSVGNIRPHVLVSVPHVALVFQRDQGRYRSVLEVMVVARRQGEQVGGGVGSGEVTVDSDLATRTRTPLQVSAPLRIRGEQPVTLEVTARVRDSSRAWQRWLHHAPRAWTAMPLWIADVGTDLSVDPAGGYQVPALADSVRLDVVLRRPREAVAWPPAGIDLVSELSGPALAQPRQRRTAVPEIAAIDTSLTLTQVWPGDRLPFGRNRLQVRLEAEVDGERWQVPREPALEILNLRVAFGDDRDWRRHVNWLEGLLPSATRDSLRAVPAAGRPQAWSAAWRRIATAEALTPDAAERRHLRRIVTADDRFGGFGRGALSDRGRILIRWGEPARIEVFADERVPGAMHEVWSHPAAGLRFVFYDAHGLGDFRLQQTLPLEG
jgi:GWxTD domain-containing protein